MTASRPSATLASLLLVVILGFAAPANAATDSLTSASASTATVLPAHSVIDLSTGKVMDAPPLRSAQMYSCASGQICLYDYWCTCPVYYDLWAGSAVSTTCSTLSSNMRDKTSYIWNNSGYRFEVFTGDTPGSCNGAVGTIWRNSDGSMGYPFNNSIDAIRRVCAC